MKLLTALSVISVTGALATNHAIAMADSLSVEPSSSQTAAFTPHAMVMETSTSAIMAHEPATSSVMVHETATAMVHQMTSAAMAHETTTSVMVHETTSMAAAYTASISPPMVHVGAMTHTVIVGGTAGLVYTPNQITAAVNDVVHFVFMSQNHTVTESTFALPCNKKATDAPDSGFLSNPNNTIVPAPTWEYTVTSTEPTWWYCKQRTGAHCGKGMVFAINPTVEKSFDAFKMAAISINGTAAATGTSAAAAVTATAVGTVTLIADSAVATTTSLVTDAAATASIAPIVTGWNEGGASCQCACFCGVGAFPQGDGVGAYGGYGGSLPAPW